MTREETIKYIDNLHKKILSRFADKVSEKEMQSFCMAIEALKEPPRVHAYWVIDLDGVPYCSDCTEYTLAGFSSVHQIVRNMKYCPHCGAIMDEVK